MKNSETSASGKKGSYRAPDITRTLDNDIAVLRNVARHILSEVKKKNVTPDLLFDVNLALQETLQNAMIHGNKMSDKKKVKLDAWIDDEYFKVSVEDEGEGFDPYALPDPTLKENLLKEGGRGVFLLMKLMDEVDYEKDGRKVVIKRYFNRGKGK